MFMWVITHTFCGRMCSVNWNSLIWLWADVRPRLHNTHTHHWPYVLFYSSNDQWFLILDTTFILFQAEIYHDVRIHIEHLPYINCPIMPENTRWHNTNAHGIESWHEKIPSDLEVSDIYIYIKLLVIYLTNDIPGADSFDLARMSKKGLWTSLQLFTLGVGFVLAEADGFVEWPFCCWKRDIRRQVYQYHVSINHQVLSDWGMDYAGKTHRWLPRGMI